MAVAVRFTDFAGRSVRSASTAMGEVAGAVVVILVAGVEASSGVVDDAATAASTTTFLRATFGVARGDDERGALLADADAAADAALLLVPAALLKPLAPCGGDVPMNRLSSWATRCWLRWNSCSR